MIFLRELKENKSVEFFFNGAELLLNSVNHMCLAGTVVV